MKLVYIAGPYRARTAWEVAMHIRHAESIGREVAIMGYMPVIPHLMSGSFGADLDDDFWLSGTLETLRRCDAVVLVPGWEESSGTRAEKAEAERLGLPVFFSVRGLGEWRP